MSNQSAKSIFLAAIEGIQPERWPGFLDEACGNNGDLRAQVEKLLRGHRRLGAFPESNDDQSEATQDRSLASEQIGATIGPYKLLEQIGEGGMGLVYMAEQHRPVRRLVALKIVKPGMDSRQVIARFEAERQAVAMMDHPNIARVLDAGTTDTGSPYFAMELVRGIPITNLCDDKRLTVRERLELFIPVCQAVQHAHQKGIIHRDLKPSNVLVTMHDTVAFPKVIDFGIAKALGQQLTEHTLHTGFAQLVGTPLYMSPEQAEMNQLGVDTRSDVYSLGVLLYELLTGTTPFDKETLSKSGLDEMRRMIREVEPPRPSDRVSTLAAESLSTISDRQRAEPHRIATVLRGELDWIVMKALEKDRTRRYESASALAADIQHYLDDEPVQACPPNVTYRLLKVVRRHRIAAMAASAITFTVLASSAFSSLKYVDERAARREADEQKLVAVQNAAEATRERESAVRQKAEAERQRDAVRQNLYYGDTRLAFVDIGTGNAGRARDTLLAHLPEQGDADRRGWEWYYLLGRSHEAELALYGHQAEIITMAWSPDGNYLASVSNDGSARVWDVKTGKQLRRFDHGPTIKKGIHWSPDSRKLAWGSTRRESAIRIWDRDTDKIAVLHGHKESVWAVAWSHDGKHLATGNIQALNPEPGNVRIWDVERLESVAQFTTGPLEIALSASWSADDGYLAVATTPRNLFIWNTSTHEAIENNIQKATWASWHPTEMRLAVGKGDGSSLIWDFESRNTTLRWSAHRGQIREIQWSKDGLYLLTAGSDGAAKVWDAKDGHEQRSVAAHAGAANSVAWDVSGERFATAGTDRVIRVWTTKNQPSPLVIETRLHGGLDLAWDNESESVFVASGDAEKIVAFRADTGSVLEEIPLQLGKSQRIVSFRHILERLAPTAGGPVEFNILHVPVNGTLSKIVSPASFNSGHVLDSILSPDRMRIAYFSLENQAWRPVICDVHSRRIVQGPEIIRPHGIAWSPDGRFIAVPGSGDASDGGNLGYAGWVHVFDADTGERLRKLRIGTERIQASAAAWSHDGRKIAAGTALGLCEVWDVESGRRLISERIHSAQVNDLVWSLDDRRIASGGITEQVHVWDSGTGQELLALESCGAPIKHIRWSPNGLKLAAVSDDGVIRIWDATRGYQLPDRDFWPNLIEPRNRKEYQRLIAEQRWSEARDALTRFVAVQSSDYRNLYQLALLKLQLDDQAGYREVCRRMLSVFAATEGALEARATAWVCALRPGTLDDYGPAITLARRAVELNWEPAYWPPALGAILFRAGQYEEALLHLRAASEMRPDPRQSRAEIAFLQAITHQRLGRADDARMWLDRANREADAERNDKSNVPTWEQQLILNLFQREATELIDGRR